MNRPGLSEACTAASRVLVHVDRYEEVVRRLAAAVKRLKVGNCGRGHARRTAGDPGAAACSPATASAPFRRGGTVCVSGSLSGRLIPRFEPIAMIPPGTKLTAFHSDSLKGAAGAPVLQRVVDEVQAGVYRPNVDRVFDLEDIVEAHRHMENDQAAGKVVVLPQASHRDL